MLETDLVSTDSGQEKAIQGLQANPSAKLVNSLDSRFAVCHDAGQSQKVGYLMDSGAATMGSDST